LSGQPRSIEFATPSILRYFSGRDHEYDFFCHSWNYNTWKLQDGTYTNDEPVDYFWLNNQLDRFRPKAKIIETKEELYKAYRPHTDVHYGSLLYSLMYSNHLKRLYEIQNNFRYDCVLKCRYDSVFDPKSSFANVLKSNSYNNSQKLYISHI
jgi:hypothetical protein